MEELLDTVLLVVLFLVAWFFLFLGDSLDTLLVVVDEGLDGREFCALALEGVVLVFCFFVVVVVFVVVVFVFVVFVGVAVFGGFSFFGVGLDGFWNFFDWLWKVLVSGSDGGGKRCCWWEGTGDAV